MSDPHSPPAASAPELPPGSPPERSPPPTGYCCTSWAPSRIPVAEPPVKRRARRRKPEKRWRQCSGILQNLLPARGGVRGALGRSDSQPGDRPLLSRPSRQTRGAGGCPRSLASPSRVPTPPRPGREGKLSPRVGTCTELQVGTVTASAAAARGSRRARAVPDDGGERRR